MANKNNPGALDANEMLQTSEAFFFKNKKLILTAVAVIVLVIAGIFLYKSLIAAPREEKASTALAKGQEYFNQEQFDKALNGDGAGYAGFAKIADDFGGTNAANLANLYAGLCNANLNRWEAAQKFLDAYSPSADAMVSPAAVAALGNAYAHLNQLDKAVDFLKKAAKLADSKAEDGTNNSLSPLFLLQAGEILESQNKKEEALNLYQDIKKKYVNSPLVQRSEIDKYIERASTK
ncbi:tetratricopeptide repeat protein [Prevotella sp. oral taxon 475]|uniref:tetratricopeptide repeat protein n=1 Tax=Prevotella sp. oral taxon 475 TaxID=712471 RepID=UPI001BAA0B86|nr:tetratricopeptide repeat protein [Prevotella sp. oral taxon 475]QUB46633.1 tetratricopeptide repeat protein [Prevotella sp. oral taxon 475]